MVVVAVGDGSLADGIGAGVFTGCSIQRPAQYVSAFQSGGYIGQGRIGRTVHFVFGIGYDGYCFWRDGQIGTGNK